MSKSFHLVCSPARCIDLVTGILDRRKQLHQQNNTTDERPPLFVWEPNPSQCNPEQLEKCREALKHVDVVSPNQSELTAFFGVSAYPTGWLDREVIERCCKDWATSGIGGDGNGVVVVRAGKDGCFVAKGALKFWLPAYHPSAEKVIDPTGGGNTFLGGLAVTLARGHSLTYAAMCGSIAASFAIEQVGMPTLSQGPDGELWNGERVVDRIIEYGARLREYIQR